MVQIITNSEGNPVAVATKLTPPQLVQIESDYVQFVEGLVSDFAGKTGVTAEQVRESWGSDSTKKSMLGQLAQGLLKEGVMIGMHSQFTAKCEGVQPFRFNPDGTQDGVGLDHEVKMGIYKKNNTYHVVITTGDHEIDNSALEGAHLCSAQDLGLVAYTINPFNAVEALKKIFDNNPKATAIFHLDDLSLTDAKFVYNNCGHNLTTVSVPSEDYLSAVGSAISSLEQTRVELRSETKKLETFSKEIQYCTDKRLSDEERKALFLGKPIGRDVGDIFYKEDRSTGESDMADAIRVAEELGSKFKAIDQGKDSGLGSPTADRLSQKALQLQ